jgi:hypothetical protein
MSKPFGYGWSQEKLLCYGVRSAIISTLGCLELLQESKLSPRDAKLAETMLKNTKLAAEQVEELFQTICKKERSSSVKTER